jgi:hypothetical protein
MFSGGFGRMHENDTHENMGEGAGLKTAGFLLHDAV